MLLSRVALTAFAALALCVSSPAQTAITAITTSSADTWNSSVNGTTFENTVVSVTSFSAGGYTYTVSSTATSATARRNNVNATQSSAWYDQGASSSQFSSTYASTYGSLLLGNNILRGSDNTFANGSAINEGNIERLDFLFSTSGVTATADMAFAIFDRGEVGVHDGVKIALITSLGTIRVNGTNYTNAPSGYAGTLVSVDSSDYGTSNVVSDFTYNLFRYDENNNLSDWTENSETGTQGIGGVTISLADLGVAAGTKIYGYSLFGNDVTAGGSASSLADWSNASYYPTSTSSSTGTGGIDLAAVNGLLFKKTPVPEPSTYGALLVAAAMGVVMLRRRRRAPRGGCAA